MSIMRSTLRTDSNKENGKPEYGFAKFTDIAFIWLANIVDKENSYLKTGQRIRSISPNGTCVIFIECSNFDLVLLSSLIFRIMPMGSIKHDLSIVMNVTPNCESALLKL